MIELAIKHELELQSLFTDIAFDERFKFYHPFSFREKYIAPADTWSKIDWAVLENGKVTGFIGYSIDRDSLVVSDLKAINFCGTSLSFAKAIMKVITGLFTIFKFRKLRFSVVVGNPIEPSYDRLVQRFGGRICGLWKSEDKLFDGTLADRKWYEIMGDDFVSRLQSDAILMTNSNNRTHIVQQTKVEFR